MRRQGVHAAGQEAQEDVLSGLPRRVLSRLDGDLEVVLGVEAELSTVAEAVLKEGAGKTEEPGKSVEDACCDEVVPASEHVVAVEEEEDEEDDGEEDVSRLEELIEAVAVDFALEAMDLG